MARGKGKSKAQRQVEEDLARSRRNSAAHRSLRRRAQKGTGARAVPSHEVEPAVDEVENEPFDGDSGARTSGERFAPEESAPGDHSGEDHSREDPATDESATDEQAYDDSAAQPSAEHAPDDEPERASDRVPTSELSAPAWLAASSAATSGSPEETYEPRYDPHPDEDESLDDRQDDDGAAMSSGDDNSDGDVAAGGTGAPERTSVFAPSSEIPVQPSDGEPTAVDSTPVDATAVYSSSDHPAEGDTEVMSPVDAESDPAAAGSPPWAGSADDDGPDEDSEGPRRKRRRAAWAVPLALVGIAVVYVGAQALLSTTVPRGTEMLGMDIGSMSVTEATEEVEGETDVLESTDLELRAAEQSFAVPARDAGLSIDVERTLDEVTGFTLAPDRLWAHIAGGGELSPVTEVDEDSLADALETAAVQLDGPAQDAGVTFAEAAVEVVPGRAAVTVDQEASAQRIVTVWPAAQSIDLVAETEPPAITDEDAADFASELETEILAAPITLVGDEAEATIEPATIASMSTVESGPGGLELTVDGGALADRIIEDNPELTTEGDNASVSFDDNQQIVIDEGSPGITIDGEALGEAVLSAAGSAERIGELPYTSAEPEVSAEDLGLADFQEIISSFDTPVTSDAVRTQNLRVAAADVEGVVVLPGENFDLTEALSPINEEEGYQDSGVIVNGILTSGMGGGLSQMATTAYNAGYFAGFEILDHRPHSVWFTRYPAGRESTIYTGSINVEFRNNTPYAAVFNSYVANGRLYVDVWSTEHFEVTTSASPKTNITEPGVKEVSSANCAPKGPGQPGFTITNTRTVYLDDEQVDQTSNTWTYQPDDAIECVSDEGDDD
ncbi:VanW family protein [Demequina sp. SO4-13]|uniref:VanW family protein n=1 Tax=Demequina sp. SO4-13 TaxID=3401027 RepID=UPI003AF463F1